MAVVPFLTLVLLNRPQSGTRPMAETVFTALFAAIALYAIFNEGSQNWQALWTSAAYFLFGATLWRARGIAVAATTSTGPVVASEAEGLSERKEAALDPMGMF